MRKPTLTLLALSLATPLWAAGHGSGHSAGTMNHGATVSQAARMSSGSSVRDTARANSQGPIHANANALQHVQNSPGQASVNSVLGTGSASATTSAATQHGKSGHR